MSINLNPLGPEECPAPQVPRFEPIGDEIVNAVRSLGVLQDENISGNLKCIALKHSNVHDRYFPRWTANSAATRAE